MSVIFTSADGARGGCSSHLSILIGDVVYLHVLGQGVVFLNSHEAASELLDKRATIYSDRLSFVMLGELYVFFGPCRFIGLTGNNF